MNPYTALQNSEQELIPWLLLAQAPGVGPVHFNRLLDEYLQPERVFAAADSIQNDRLRNYLLNPDFKVIEQALEWAESPGHHIITRNHPAYPHYLAQLPDAPPLLFTIGDMELLSAPQIAMVGSRNPSQGGIETARSFAHDLAVSGFAVTSGLAIGIDGAAHHGALLARGKTIAVTGCGPDRIYPARHNKLARQILEENGSIITEFFPKTPPHAPNFPRRNRIISGLSMGVVVVEAAMQSGTLITAKLAMEQGREVFAIPGSIHNPLSKGCNELIREGAVLTRSVDDILTELAPQLRHRLDKQPVQAVPELDQDEHHLLRFIPDAPTSFDDLIVRSALTADVVSSILLSLEMKGLVEVVAGQYQRTPMRY